MLDISDEIQEDFDRARQRIINAARTIVIYHRLNSDETLKEKAFSELLEADKHYSDILDALFPAE